MDPSIRCTEFNSFFRKKLLEFTRPIGNSIYRINNPIGIKLLNRLRVGFSHLQKHKFRHNFADTINLICACAIETECSKNFFLRCHNNISFKTTLMNKLRDIDSSLASHSCSDILKVILHRGKRFNPCTNKQYYYF